MEDSNKRGSTRHEIGSAIPADIVMFIANLLDSASDLLSLALVCRRWTVILRFDGSGEYSKQMAQLLSHFLTQTVSHDKHQRDTVLWYQRLPNGLPHGKQQRYGAYYSRIGQDYQDLCRSNSKTEKEIVEAMKQLIFKYQLGAGRYFVLRETTFWKGKRDGVEKNYDQESWSSEPLLVSILKWKNDQLHGECEYYTSGSCYAKHTYVEGQQHGKQISYQANAEDHTEYYKGQMHGAFKRFRKDTGELWETANYQRGKAQGISLVFFKGGAVERQETYNNGLPQLSKTFNQDGQCVSLINFNNDGIKHGESFRWHSNGQTASRVTFINAFQEGLYEEWFPDGIRSMVLNFNNSKKVGERRIWYESGVLKSQTALDEDKRHGLHEVYYENGNKKKQCMFSRTKKHGVCQTFYQDGALQSKCIFVDGKQDDLTYFYFEDGKLQQTELWNKGFKCEQHAYFPNGQLESKLVFTQNPDKCTYDEYYENGQLAKHAVVAADKELIAVTYKENGDLESSVDLT